MRSGQTGGLPRGTRPLKHANRTQKMRRKYQRPQQNNQNILRSDIATRRRCDNALECIAAFVRTVHPEGPANACTIHLKWHHDTNENDLGNVYNQKNMNNNEAQLEEAGNGKECSATCASLMRALRASWEDVLPRNTSKTGSFKKVIPICIEWIA